MSRQLYCPNCSHWLGESSAALTFAGMFEGPQLRHNVSEPRDTYRCKSCGWITVFRSTPRSSDANWRIMQLKR